MVIYSIYNYHIFPYTFLAVDSSAHRFLSVSDPSFPASAECRNRIPGKGRIEESEHQNVSEEWNKEKETEKEIEKEQNGKSKEKKETAYQKTFRKTIFQKIIRIIS